MHMPPMRRLLCFGAVVGLLAGCASTPVRTSDTDIGVKKVAVISILSESVAAQKDRTDRFQQR